MSVSLSPGKRKRDEPSGAAHDEPSSKRARPDVVLSLLAASSSRPTALPSLPTALLQLPRIAQPPPQPTLRTPALTAPLTFPSALAPPSTIPFSNTVLHAIRLQRDLLTPQVAPVLFPPRPSALSPAVAATLRPRTAAPFTAPLTASPVAAAAASSAPASAFAAVRPLASSSLALASVTSALGLAYLNSEQRSTIAVRRLQRKHVVRHVKREHAAALVTPWSLDARVLAADSTLALHRVTLHLPRTAHAHAHAHKRIAASTLPREAPRDDTRARHTTHDTAAAAREGHGTAADADEDAPSESRLLEAYLRHTVTQRGEARRALLDYYRVNPHLVPTLAESLLGRGADAYVCYARSPHSGRRLRAQLWRDTVVCAPWSRVMAELAAYWRTRSAEVDATTAPVALSRPVLVYAHVRPEHVPQINALLHAAFWRDIDVSESLLWPEYTVVAQWGRLVVGCALMTPQGYITYVCVHAQWRRLGLSRVMLALLLQALPDRDVTLHVSVSNHEALALYHRFGFKPEEYILDFYKHYLPVDTALSVHAFLLRFRRA